MAVKYIKPKLNKKSNGEIRVWPMPESIVKDLIKKHGKNAVRNMSSFSKKSKIK